MTLSCGAFHQRGRVDWLYKKWRKTDGWADAAMNQQSGSLTSSLTGSKDLRRICLKLDRFLYEQRLNNRKSEKGWGGVEKLLKTKTTSQDMLLWGVCCKGTVHAKIDFITIILCRAQKEIFWRNFKLLFSMQHLRSHIQIRHMKTHLGLCQV